MDIPDLVGRQAITHHLVTAADTAEAVGSGSLPVLGTPRLIAWLEGATCAAIDSELGAGLTSVGTRVEIEHLAATAVGGEIACTATVMRQSTRTLSYAVTAVDSHGTDVGRGTIARVVVDAERFLSRLP